MPRVPRIHFPGALFHAMARGNGGQKIFLNDDDFRVFLGFLAEVKSRKPFRLFAYCLMTNHFHLLIEVDQTPIPVLMQRLMLRYAKHFNIRGKRFGHVFQGRYKAILCQQQTYLLELLRYIHLNPVRAGIARTPEDWPWSGHRAFMGLEPPGSVDVGFPLAQFHAEPAHARGLYRRFIQDGIGSNDRDEFRPADSFPCLGDSDFEGDFRDRLERIANHHSPPPPPEPLPAIAARVALTDGIQLEALRSASKLPSVAAAKRTFIHQAVANGFTPSEIADYLGG